MTVILILTGILLGVGSILYAHHRLTGGDNPHSLAESYHRLNPDPDNHSPASPSVDTPLLSHKKTEANGICCGLHEICEKTLPPTDPSALYFDDEELDTYIGRQPDKYSSQEADIFRDIMLTMLPSDLPAWASALSRRGIAMPAEVKEEFMLLLAEALPDNHPANPAPHQ